MKRQFEELAADNLGGTAGVSGSGGDVARWSRWSRWPSVVAEVVSVARVVAVVVSPVAERVARWAWWRWFGRRWRMAAAVAVVGLPPALRLRASIRPLGCQKRHPLPVPITPVPMGRRRNSSGDSGQFVGGMISGGGTLAVAGQAREVLRNRVDQFGNCRACDMRKPERHSRLFWTIPAQTVRGRNIKRTITGNQKQLFAVRGRLILEQVCRFRHQPPIRWDNFREMPAASGSDRQTQMRATQTQTINGFASDSFDSDDGIADAQNQAGHPANNFIEDQAGEGFDRLGNAGDGNFARSMVLGASRSMPVTR